MNASRILDLFDDNQEDLDEVKNAFKASYTFIQNTEALPGLLSDTPSAILHKYRSLSRWEKVQQLGRMA